MGKTDMSKDNFDDFNELDEDFAPINDESIPVDEEPPAKEGKNPSARDKKRLQNRRKLEDLLEKKSFQKKEEQFIEDLENESYYDSLLKEDEKPTLPKKKE